VTYTLNHGATKRCRSSQPSGKKWFLAQDDVVRTLRELAAERPDFVYEPEIGEEGADHYRYCHKDGPGCIVGHVVAKLLPEFPLGNLDIDPAKRFDSGTSAEVAIPRWGIGLEPATLDLLRSVQGNQDDEKSWGDAVRLVLDS
jgi:hypothetical protein